MPQNITPTPSSTPHYNSAAPAGTRLFTVASCTGPGGAQPWLKVTDSGASAVVQVKPEFAADVLAYPGAPKYVLASDAEVASQASRVAAGTAAEAAALEARQAAVQARADTAKGHV
jgi:hypothetical protein